ncbi:MAG: hypothetical protein V4692_01905, partial [Bdellovibrionota bacterium]
MKSVSMAIVLFLAPQVFAETRTNRIFEVGKTEGPALFTQSTEIDTKENGDRSWVSKIKDASGNVVMTEIAF